MLKKIVLPLLLSLSLYGESCWTSLELAELADKELNGKTLFSVKDAVSCKPLSGVDLTLGKFHFTSDKNGVIALPTPPSTLDATLPILLSKSGYIPSKESVVVSFGSYWSNRFLMTKELPLQSARFVLSWGASPQDLDLHLKTQKYHISFRNTKNIAHKVALDRDARKGYGPETITLEKLNKNEKYRVIVNRYSRKGNIDEQTQVRVYINNKLDRLVRLHNTKRKCIEVATIRNNTVTYKTKVLDDSECK